jgi:hypothetical protein
VVATAIVALVAATVFRSGPAQAQSAGTTTTSPAGGDSTTTAAPDSTTTTTAADGTTTTTVAPIPEGPVPSDGTTTTTAPPGATTTLAPIPQGPVPSNPAPPTTVPPPGVAVPTQQLDTVLQGLQGDLAQLAAIDAYQRDQAAVAAARVTAADADSAVARAAQITDQATVTHETAVVTVGTNVRHLSGLAIALYINENLASETVGDILADTSADRAVMLHILLDGGKQQVKTARQQVTVAAQQVSDAGKALAAARAQQTAVHRALGQAEALVAMDKAAALGHPAKARTAVAASPTIMGGPILTAAEIAGWFAAMGHPANVTVPMAQLAGDYIDVGGTEGVRGDVAFAQSVIETGYFGFPAGGLLVATDNNFAGIGACDNCAHGWSFPDARTGVAAQLELLHAYASSTPVATPLVGKVGVTGCCPTWLSLTGVWASAPQYGYEVLAIYRQMVDWALPGRLAAAGLVPPPAGSSVASAGAARATGSTGR